MERYIQHRLQVAGGERPAELQPLGARRASTATRGGVPRLVNAVCDKTLLCGYVTGDDHLTWRHVRRADPRAGGGVLMSLIDEALRRARQEAARQDAAARERPTGRCR